MKGRNPIHQHDEGMPTTSLFVAIYEARGVLQDERQQPL
jgi:hypothetical protein